MGGKMPGDVLIGRFSTAMLRQKWENQKFSVYERFGLVLKV